MAYLTKQDLVLKKIIEAIEEDRKNDIAQLGNYYKLTITIYTLTEDAFTSTID